MNKDEVIFNETVNCYDELIRFCEAKTGIFVDNYQDELTWKLFSEGRYSSPLFIPEYPSDVIKPKNFEELSEYVARGFFVQKQYTLAMFLFLKYAKDNPKRLIFRDDVDKLVFESFEKIGNASHEKIKSILAELRDDKSMDAGKDRLHNLCKNIGVAERHEEIICGKIILTAPIYAVKDIACMFAKKVYIIGYFQANFWDKYLYVIDRFNK